MDIFEYATKNKLRFETNRGFVNTEDLWDMPLLSDNGFNLDEVAKTIARTIKSKEEESFVKKTSSAVSEQKALDVVKHIIQYKIGLEDARKKSAEIAAQRQNLLEALEKKRTESLTSMDIEELEAKLKELSEPA